MKVFWIIPKHLVIAVTLMALFIQGRAVAEVVSDPEPGTIRFASATYQVDEGAGTVTLTVQRISGSDGAVGISYATSDGTAHAPGDYTAKSGNLSWTTGDSSNKTISITIIDDGIPEEDETFFVTLSNPTGGATLGTPHIATVTIIDNEPRVSLSLVGSTSADEDTAGTRTFRATFDRTSNMTVTVPFTITGTATSARNALLSNYLSNGWLKDNLDRWDVAQGGGSDGLVVRSSDDSVFGDASAKFTASISGGFIYLRYRLFEDIGENPFDPTTQYTISFWARTEQEQQVYLNIADSNDHYEVAEFGSHTIGTSWERYDFTFTPIDAGNLPLMRFRVFQDDLPITLYVDGLRLVEGSSPAPFGDYERLTNSPLVFTPGQTEKDIDVHIIPDPFWETNETVTVNLGTPTNAGLGSTTSQTFTINNDDDLPVANFSGPTQVSEADESFSLELNLSHGFFETPTVVHLNYSNGSALLGTHFNGPQSVTFQPGETTKELLFTLIDDGLFSHDKQIFVEIDYTGSPVTPGTNGEAVILITEANPLPVATIWGPHLISEDRGEVELTVVLSTDLTAIPIEVPFSIGGTAINPDHYTLGVASPLIIPPGQDRGTIPITLVDSADKDGDRDIVITLLEDTISPTSTPGTPYTHKLVIVDSPTHGPTNPNSYKTQRLQLFARVATSGVGVPQNHLPVEVKWVDRGDPLSAESYEIWRLREHAPQPELVSEVPVTSNTMTIMDAVPNNATYTYTVRMGQDTSHGSVVPVYQIPLSGGGE